MIGKNHIVIFIANIIVGVSCAQRIPRVLVPIKYDLTLTAYFESELQSHFEGALVFTFKPFKRHTAKNFSLHADRLNILSFVLEESSNNKTKQLIGTKSEFDSYSQLLSFDSEFPLSVDFNYKLHINYTGNITDDGWGFYKGAYTENGRKRYYAATQLRPVFGRRLLPCLDEPIYKARFTVRIWRLPSFKAVSNMPLIITSPVSLESGRVLDTFAESPPMSTFLLALAVFDFASLTSKDRNLKFSSWTIPSKLSLAEYGHNMIPRLVGAMEVETGSAFPLAKLDQVALPRLNPPAMENWGLNTYREANMLVWEGNGSARARQDVPRFTAHEVAHHWLGNLVSLQWWDHLWLTEAYAMYYEYHLPSKVEPSWRMSDQLTVALTAPGLVQDSLAGAAPLTTRVATNEEVLAKFTGLAYTKGPALIRMVHETMSESSVKRTLSALVREKKYSTVNPSELWRFYDETMEGLPASMEEIMATWTDQPGYPLVTVSMTANQSGTIVTLTQERFLQDGSSGQGRWWVPVSLVTGPSRSRAHTSARVWLGPHTHPSTTLPIPLATHAWFIVNPDRQGFFRVQYGSERWRHLSNVLHSTPSDVPDLSRAMLVDDALSLARAGRLDYGTALGLTAYLRRDACYFPWATVLPRFAFLLDTFNNHPAHSMLKKMSRPDSHLTQLLRLTVAPFACSLRLTHCTSHALGLQKTTSTGRPSVVAAGLEYTQLCAVLEAGSLTLTPAAAGWSEEERITAMPCVRNKTELVTYLSEGVNQDTAQQWAAKVSAAIGRPENIEPVLYLLLERHADIIKRFGADSFANYFTQLENFLSTKSQLEKMEATLRHLDDQSLLAVLKIVRESLRKRISWIEKYGGEIESWLRQYKKNYYKQQNTAATLVYCQ